MICKKLKEKNIQPSAFIEWFLVMNYKLFGTGIKCYVCDPFSEEPSSRLTNRYLKLYSPENLISVEKANFSTNQKSTILILT